MMDEPGPEDTDRALTDAELEAEASDDFSLEELAAQLERDPGECRRAVEGLESLDSRTRLRIIEGLAMVPKGPGIVAFLQLLCSADDPMTRASALAALNSPDIPTHEGVGTGSPAIGVSRPGTELTVCDPGKSVRREGRSRTWLPARGSANPVLLRSLVTAVDGEGRGSVVISASEDSQRRTAAYLFDLESGIRDVVGVIEPESPDAGGLLVDVLDQARGQCVEDVPELAIGLLAGSLTLNGPSVPPLVRNWLDATLGTGFGPRAFSAPEPEWDPSLITGLELQRRVGEVLDACPTWIDASGLTFELAEEICLREGQGTADPDRDAGAYRFLFEHRLIHRLGLYQRMLFCMAWFWRCSGDTELSLSARVLAWQLADEQYAVPSHPFTVALTTRSLDAAQHRLRTPADPRLLHGEK